MRDATDDFQDAWAWMMDPHRSKEYFLWDISASEEKYPPEILEALSNDARKIASPMSRGLWRTAELARPSSFLSEDQSPTVSPYTSKTSFCWSW